MHSPFRIELAAFIEANGLLSPLEHPAMLVIHHSLVLRFERLPLLEEHFLANRHVFLKRRLFEPPPAVLALLPLVLRVHSLPHNPIFKSSSYFFLVAGFGGLRVLLADIFLSARAVAF